MSEEQKEPGIAISGIAITRQIALLPNKDNLTFQVGIDSTTDDADLNDLLDRIGRAANRQRAIAELPEKEQALEIAYGQPAALEREIARLQALRAAHVGGMQAAWDAAARRGPFKPNEKQQAQIDQYDKQIEQAMKSRGSFTRDIAICEWEVARRRALIECLPEPPKPQEIDDAVTDLRLAQAAE